MGYDEPVDPTDDEAGEPDHPAAGGSIYADALDSLAQEESELPRDPGVRSAADVNPDPGVDDHDDAADELNTDGLSGLLGMFDDAPPSAPVGPGLVVAPSVLPPPSAVAAPAAVAPPPLSQPDGAVGTSVGTSVESAVESAADYPPPPPSDSSSDSGSAGDPIRLPVSEGHCAMCGMTVPIDQDRGKCHLGHRQR